MGSARPHASRSNGGEEDMKKITVAMAAGVLVPKFEDAIGYR